MSENATEIDGARKSPARGIALTTSLVLLYDTLAAAGAMFASLMLRYHFSEYSVPPGALEYMAPAVFAPISAAVFLTLGVHRGSVAPHVHAGPVANRAGGPAVPSDFPASLLCHEPA